MANKYGYQLKGSKLISNFMSYQIALANTNVY